MDIRACNEVIAFVYWIQSLKDKTNKQKQKTKKLGGWRYHRVLTCLARHS